MFVYIDEFNAAIHSSEQSIERLLGNGFGFVAERVIHKLPLGIDSPGKFRLAYARLRQHQAQRLC